MPLFCFLLPCCSLFEARRGVVGRFTACPLRCELWVQEIGHVLLGLYFVGIIIRIAEIHQHLIKLSVSRHRKSFWLVNYEDASCSALPGHNSRFILDERDDDRLLSSLQPSCDGKNSIHEIPVAYLDLQDPRFRKVFRGFALV